MRLLFIEPDLILAKINKNIFETQGHSVVICATAQSAIFAADEIKPDLVILELQLIGHSGIEFLYEFRSYLEWQTIPVIVYTNVPIGEFAQSYQFMKSELGVTDYLYKPKASLAKLQLSIEQLKPVIS